MSSQGSIDLIQFATRPGFVISIATAPDAEEAAYKRQRASQDALHRRRIFWAVFGVLLAMLVIAILIIVFADNDATHAWARDAVSAIVGLMAGYAGGVVANKADY